MRSPQVEVTRDLKFIQVYDSTSADFFFSSNFALCLKFVITFHISSMLHNIFQFGSETIATSSTTLKREYAYNEGNQRNKYI